MTEERMILTTNLTDLGHTRPHASGEIEILAITAGIGNGWNFTAEALRESLPLWNKREVFIDHSWGPHSIRDLAGVIFDPTWDENAQGIQCTLKPFGPAAGLLSALAEEMLQDDEEKPNVGFSADLYFQANESTHPPTVDCILKVSSVDLVISPARGGAFVRALNSIYPPMQNSQNSASSKNEIFTTRSNNMPRTEPQTPKMNPQGSSAIEAELGAARELLAAANDAKKAQDEAEKVREIRKQMCAHLLDSALGASRLPEAAAKRVRTQFADRIFENAELTAAIEDARELVSELTGGLVVQGPGRVHSMFSTEDQLQAAVDDLFGAPRNEGAEKLDAARLTGIKELYLMLTGDRDFYGGYFADRVQLATTADFTGLVKNALNKIVVNTWDELGRAGYDWWKRISTIEHFSSTQGITGTLVGTVGSLPTVAEGAEYTELVISDSPETASFVKYGGYIPLTLELIDRDETRKLRAYPRELASAALRNISALVAAVFTDNSGTGPTMADTGALFNATAVTTAGGHANLLTTALAAAEWDMVSTAVYNQPMLIKNASGYYGTGPKMAINPRYCVVPRSLQLTAMKILYPTLENAANIYSENLQRGQPGDVVTVPEWTDATDWAAVCDPRLAPAIYVGERFGIMPEIYISSSENAGAVFTNDEHRLKVRHFLAVWVNDFRPLHKSNVA